MAFSIRALAGLARCERPTSADFSASVVQPGRFAHGPDEKFGLAGFTAGAVRGISAMATLPGRKPHGRVRCPKAADTPPPAFVQVTVVRRLLADGCRWCAAAEE